MHSELSALQTSDMWKQLETRVVFWRKCYQLMAKDHTPPLVAAVFYQVCTASLISNWTVRVAQLHFFQTAWTDCVIHLHSFQTGRSVSHSFTLFKMDYMCQTSLLTAWTDCVIHLHSFQTGLSMSHSFTHFKLHGLTVSQGFIHFKLDGLCHTASLFSKWTICVRHLC